MCTVCSREKRPQIALKYLLSHFQTSSLLVTTNHNFLELLAKKNYINSARKLLDSHCPILGLENSYRTLGNMIVLNLKLLE